MVARCRNFVSSAADPATAARVIAALDGAGVPNLSKVKLLNAKADTDIKAFLADGTLENPGEVAKLVAAAWTGGEGGEGGSEGGAAGSGHR